MRLIRPRPTGVHHGFASGFYDMSLNSFLQSRATLLIERPNAQQCLIQKIFFVAVGHSVTADLFLVPGVLARPQSQLLLPLGRNLGKYIQAGAYIFTALRFVGGTGV